MFAHVTLPLSEEGAADVASRQRPMTPPFSPDDTGDVQTENRQGTNNDHTRSGVHPLPEVRGEDDRRRAGAEIKCKLDGDTGRKDVNCAADGENDTLQRASFRWGRVLPPPQTPIRSAFQRGWVGGRFFVTILVLPDTHRRELPRSAGDISDHSPRRDLG